MSGEGKTGYLLAAAGGLGVAAAGLLWGRGQRPASGGRKVSAAYLRLYLPTLQRWAATYKAPASLMAAIVANESGFDPEAKNLISPGDVARGGAWGLGQLTLQTALGLAKGAPTVAPTWNKTGPGLLDPETNLALTAWGVRQNWQRFAAKRPNPWLYAGVAWNVGAGAVEKMLAAGPGRVEAFPYAAHLIAQVKNNPPIQALYAAEVAAGAHYAEVFV